VERKCRQQDAAAKFDLEATILALQHECDEALKVVGGRRTEKRAVSKKVGDVNDGSSSSSSSGGSGDVKGNGDNKHHIAERWLEASKEETILSRAFIDSLRERAQKRIGQQGKLLVSEEAKQVEAKSEERD